MQNIAEAGTRTVTAVTERKGGGGKLKENETEQGVAKHISLIKFIKPTSHALKCENNRYTISYMFRHFLTPIIRESLC